MPIWKSALTGWVKGILSLEPALAKYTRRGVGNLESLLVVNYSLTQPYEFTRGQYFSPDGAG